jgi:hypothetical protein
MCWGTIAIAYSERYGHWRSAGVEASNQTGQDVVVDLDTVGTELYGLRPTEFTAARDAQAAAARHDGDRELATAIKKLRRPTPAAWLVNLLARERPDQVSRLLELGSAMRRAQSALAATDLRRLSAERRTVLGALVREARDLAASAEQTVSEASWRELETTLEAALVDADAGDAVKTGRLTIGLRYSGLGPVDLTGAVATPTGRGERRPMATSRPATNHGASGHERRTGIAAAERAVREAEAAADRLQQEADELDSRVREAREERRQRHQEIRSLERQIRDLRTADDRAVSVESDAEHKLEGTRRKLHNANDRAQRARTALERLRD